MNISITARHFQLPNKLKDKCHEHAKKLQQYYDKITHCNIIFESSPDKEQPSQIELVIHVPKKTLKICQSSHNYEDALHKAMLNISRQLKRYKQKRYLNSH